MKNKILLGIGVVVILGCMLFILTGCGNNDEYNQISNAIGNVDNLYIHSSDGTVSNTVNQLNNEIIDDTTDDEPTNNTGDLKQKLVGTWKYTVLDSADGTEEYPGDIYTYSFESSGTAKFTHYKAWSQVTDEYTFSSYEYDGKKIRMVEELSEGGANVIEHEISLSGSSFKEKDTGRIYHK